MIQAILHIRMPSISKWHRRSMTRTNKHFAVFVSRNKSRTRTAEWSLRVYGHSKSHKEAQITVFCKNIRRVDMKEHQFKGLIIS